MLITGLYHITHYPFGLGKILLRQNISPDDIIIEIQNRPVKSGSDVLSIIKDVVADGKENVLIVFYGGPNTRKYIGAKLSLD